MKRSMLVLAALVVCAFALPAALSAKGDDETKVVCVRFHNDEFQRGYRVEPKHCTFHRRHKPDAEAFFVHTKSLDWKFWRSGHAKAKGKSVVGMGASRGVVVNLTDPVKKCGHRVFSEAHFRDTQNGFKSKMAIDLCA